MPLPSKKRASPLLGKTALATHSPGERNGYRTQKDDLVPLGDDGVLAAWRDLRPAHAGCALVTAEHQQALGIHWEMGKGTLPAPLVVVGDSPKGEDARLERPFIGDNGAYLHNKLIDVGVDPFDAYWTHAVKCYEPKESRDRFMKAAVKEDAYRNTLLSEIRTAQPKVVLAAGQYALKMLLGLDGIVKHRGLEQWSAELGCWVVVTFAPEYVLLNTQYDEQVTSDLRKVARRMAGEDVDDRVQTTFCSTPNQVRAALRALDATPGDVVALDAETKSFLDYRRDAKVWCVALSKDPRRSYLIPLEHPESPFAVGPTDEDGNSVPWDPKLAKKAVQAHRRGDAKALGKIPHARAYLRWIARPWTEVARPELHEVYGLLRGWLRGRKVVGHNVKFDARWLRRRAITFQLYFDTQVSAHLLNENRGLRLVDRVSAELGFGNWGKGEIAFDPPDYLVRMGRYCGRDTAYTLALYRRDRVDLGDQQGLARLYRYAVQPGMEAVLQMELDGCWVDLEAVERELGVLRQQLADTQRELESYVDPVLASQGVNFNSDEFLRRWLFDPPPIGLGLSVVKLTAKNHVASTDAKVLKELSERPDAPAALLLLLKMRKQERSIVFLESWRDLVDEDQRIHPTYNICGAKTGRRSCSEPNLQQAPRETTLAGIRSCLGSPTGWVLLEVDYSQIELRIAALESGDPVMLEAYRRDRDLHRLTGVAASGKLERFVAEKGLQGSLAECALHILQDDDLYAEMAALATGEDRQKAKAINFGFLYGMGWKKFSIYARDSYGVTVTDEEAQRFRTMFFELYEGLVAWHERRRRSVQRPPYQARSFIGRVRHLPMVLSIDHSIAAKAERQAINSPVQGLGGDLVFLSEGLLHPLFRAYEAEHGERTAFQVGDVHDAVLVQIREDAVDYWVPRIVEVMERGLGLDRFGFHPEIPLKVEAKVGTRWGKLKVYEPQAA